MCTYELLTCSQSQYPVPTPTNALRKSFKKCGFSSFIIQTTIFYNLHLEVGHCTSVYDSFMTLYFMTEWLNPFSILRWFRVYRLRWLHQWPVAVSPLLLVSDENTGDGCCVPSLHCCLTPCQHLLILMVVFILQIMPLHLKEVEYPLKKMCFSCNILHT